MKTDLLFSNFPYISRGNITISKISDMDLASLWNIMGNDDNFIFAPTGALRSQEEVKDLYRRSITLFSQRRRILLGVSYLNKLIGVLGISHIDDKNQKLRINIILSRDYTGKGYATQAILATANHLFKKVEVNRIEAYLMPINIQGKRLMDRCGFIKEGLIREGFYWPDKGLVDLDLYSLLAEDFFKDSAKEKSQGRHLF